MVNLSVKLVHTFTKESELVERESDDAMIYLRGDFNFGSTSNPMERIKGGEGWGAVVFFPKGRHKFKFADALWSRVDIGASSGQNVVVKEGTPVALFKGYQPKDLIADIESSGHYQFILDDPKKDKPTLRIVKFAMD